jgi:peptidoglycan-associated lipoprotein
LFAFKSFLVFLLFVIINENYLRNLKMNNYLKLLLVFGLSFGLFACTGDEKRPDDAAVSSVSEEGDDETSQIREAVREIENKAEDSDADDSSESEDAAAKAEKEKLKTWAADELMATKIFFNYNDDRLDASDVDIIDAHIEFMKQYPETTLQLHGHADERGSQDYNLALGDRRADSVAQIFIDNGISADRISVISFGENRPIDDSHEENAWAKNRRVGFLYE